MQLKQIITQLDLDYLESQQLSQEDLNRRVAIAMENVDFAKVEKEIRKLELEISKKSAFGQDCQDENIQLNELIAKKTQICKDYNFNLQKNYKCETCLDTGWKDNKPCSCRQQKYLTLLKKYCGMTQLSNFNFEDNNFCNLLVSQKDIMQKLYKIMQKFCNNFDDTPIKAILLMGEVGIGKTSLACAVANSLLEKAHHTIYLTSFDLNNIFLNRHTNKINESNFAYGSIADCEFLVIDDLGTEPIFKNVTLEYLFSLLDSRIMSGKKTMICTNLTPDNFINRYGERALSRLTDKRYAISVGYIKGEDLRKIKK